jgi:hypothetical protein
MEEIGSIVFATGVAAEAGAGTSDQDGLGHDLVPSV